MKPESQDARRGCLLALALPFVAAWMGIVKLLSFFGIGNRKG